MAPIMARLMAGAGITRPVITGLSTVMAIRASWRSVADIGMVAIGAAVPGRAPGAVPGLGTAPAAAPAFMAPGLALAVFAARRPGARRLADFTDLAARRPEVECWLRPAFFHV
jgi:hypothetical protein